MRERFKSSCLLIAEDTQNRRQKYRTQTKDGLPEMDALMREVINDNANFCVKNLRMGTLRISLLSTAVSRICFKKGKSQMMSKSTRHTKRISTALACCTSLIRSIQISRTIWATALCRLLPRTTSLKFFTHLLKLES